MVRIRNIAIQNLLSFISAQNISFDDINYVVGPNNSGKSNIIRILSLAQKALLKNERLELSDRHLGKRMDSELVIDLTFTREEAEILLKLLTFPTNENEAKLDVSELVKNLVSKFMKARIILHWIYDGSSFGTNPKFAIFFEDSGILCNERGNVDLDIEETKGYQRSGTEAGLAFVLNHAKTELNIQNAARIDDVKTFFYKGFVIPNAEKAKYRAVSIGRVSRNQGYTHFGPDHTLTATELLDYLESVDESTTEVTLHNLIGSIFSRKVLIASELRKVIEKPLGSDDALLSDSSNLGNYLISLSTNKDGSKQKLFDKICNDFAKIFESNRISLRAVMDTQESWNSSKREIKHVPRIYIYDEALLDQLPLENVGSGIFEIIYLLTRSLTVNNGALILDEPALHLHPVQMNVLKRFLIENAKENSNQVIIITHSPVFIGKDMLEKNTQIIYMRRHDGVSRIIQIIPEDKQWIQDNLPKMKFDFNANIFFTRSIILVEGDADMGFLQGCASRNKIDIERNDIMILPVGGKLNFFKVMRILKMYSIPFVILSDKDGLTEISSNGMSALLHALKITYPDDPDVDKNIELAKEKIVDIRKDPVWLTELKKVLDSFNSDGVTTAIQSMSKKYARMSRAYDDIVFDKLIDFTAKKNIFVIREGEIEDLLKSADAALYERLTKQYGHRNTRIFAREFVEEVDATRLAYLHIGKTVLDLAVSLAK